jgi:hypothetical protein
MVLVDASTLQSLLWNANDAVRLLGVTESKWPIAEAINFGVFSL